MWSFIKEVDDLYAYFPDYQNNQLPEYDFLFKVLSTIKGNEIKELISKSRASRSVENKEEEDDIIILKNELKDEIESVLRHKSKVTMHLTLLFSHKR